MSDCKGVYASAEVGNVLVKMNEEKTFEDRYSYRETARSLTYAHTCIRPDIKNAVGIMFNGKEENSLCGHADANWTADLDSRRSTTTYEFL